MFFGFILSAILALALYGEPETSPLFIALLLGGFGICLLGLLDDVFHFKPLTKLIGQIILATFYIVAGGGFDIAPGQIFDVVLTYFWFIGIINAINLLDNMDGLASGVVVIAGAVLLILMLISGNMATSLSVLVNGVFVASVLGFWIFNRYPATIFMGDAGSLFLGFTLAALSIPNALNHLDRGGYYSLITLLLPVSVLSIPIFDTTLVTLARAVAGRAPTKGGRDHSSHRLVGLGFSENMSVAILYFLSFMGGLVAILMATYPNMTVMLFCIYAILLIVVGLYLGKKKMYPKEEAVLHDGGWTPLVTKIMYKKGMFEILLDILLVSVSFLGAIFLSGRADRSLDDWPIRSTLPMVICLAIVVNRFSGIYKGIWGLLSVEDISLFGKASMLTAVGAAAAHTYLRRHELEWNVYLLFGLLLFLLMIGSRLSFRLFDSFVGNYGLSQRPIPVILYGAGSGGKLLVDEIRHNKRFEQIRPIGFLDDDPEKKGCRVSGLNIFGDLDSFRELLNTKGAEFIKEIWVSSLSIPAEKIQRLYSLLPKSATVRQMKLDFIRVSDLTS